MKRYIYLISPPKIRGKEFYKKLDKILKTNKIKFFQLRLKKISKQKLFQIAKKIKKKLKRNNAKFIINDDPTLAKKIGANGCHIGQKDADYETARKILGKNKIIGVTCHNSKKLAINAKNKGANYIAFGSFFKSSTKKTALKANLATLRWAKKKISIPIVAIGGIDSFNYKKILSNGANFVAISGSIWNNKKLDPYSAIKKFK